jgi:hypothetical protein
MSLHTQAVHCLNRRNVPRPDENIIDDVGLTEEAIKLIDHISIYKRNPEDCPFARGNWMIDMHAEDCHVLLCVKLPLEMSHDAVMHFCQPLLDRATSIETTGSHKQH